MSGTYRITASPLSRFEPIVARVQITGIASLYISYESGGLRFQIYDPDPAKLFLGAWAERSSIVVDGSVLVVTLLPNGGWWSKDFEIVFVAGVELTPFGV